MSKMKNKFKRVLSLCLVLMLVVTFVQVSVPVKADAADTAEAVDMTDMTVDAATDAIDTADTTEVVDKADITEVTDEVDTADAVDATDTTDITDKANTADVADTISDVAVTADTTDLDVTINYADRQVQTWTAPYSGYYYIEAYGAAGGNDSSRGGYGGYVKMYTYLNEGTNLYITCGQKGWMQYGDAAKVSADNPTYNGGGRAGYSTVDSQNSSWFSGVGGGATSIALSNHGELKDFANCKNDVLIVAGGGAGGSSKSSGQGGLVLYTGSGTNYSVTNGADTSLLNGEFALGSNPGTNDGGGGGGGWIGGKSGLDSAGNSAGGGASFVNTSQRCIPIELVPDYNTKDGYVHITSTDYTEYYAISYDYDGGVAENPISYSVTQDDFTLAKPTKEGYTFTGWTGSNGDTPQKDVTIKKGTAKNLSFKANWKVNCYMLDLNGYLDEKVGYSLGQYGTADLYVNDKLVQSGVSDFNYMCPYGARYKVVIHANSNYYIGYKKDRDPNSGIKMYMGDCGVSTLEGTMNRTSTISFYPYVYTKAVNITFHRNISSSDTQTTSQKVTYGVANQKFAANIFVNNGYKFKGWSFAPNAVNADYPDNCIVADEWIDLHYPKVDLYAVWEPISWTVKYDANGGTGTMADSKHKYMVSVQLNKNTFVRNGYTFNGWVVSRVRNGKTEWLCGKTEGSWIDSWISGAEWYEKGNIPSNRKLYHFADSQVMYRSTYIDGDVITAHAQWTANTHKNRFWHFVQGFKNAEGNSTNKQAYKVKEDSSVSFTYGQSYTIDESYATQIPNGCYLDSSFGSSWHVGTNGIWEPGDWLNYKMGTTIVQADGSMFFEYDYYPYDYTITYNLNGGTNNNANPSTYTVLYGVSFKAPTRTGYTFTGWYDEKGNKVTGINEGCNAMFSSSDDLYAKLAKRTTGNKTLTARWEPIHYTVTYDANGGTGTMSTDTVTYDENYVTKANQFTRTGYEFIGWTTNADGSGSNWTSWIGKPWKWTYTKNITLYAQWKAKTYTITYEPNGGVGDRYTQTATYDAYFKTMKNRFTRTGYTFAGFIDLNGRVGTYAKINKKSFLENNALKHPWQLSKVDSEYQFYNYTDKVWETYCLIYWEGPYNVDYGCSPSNFTLSARWWANNYTVKLDYKKDVSSSYEKTIVTTYDKAYGELPQPVVQGWTFKGWNTKSDGTGTTVTADTVYKIAGDSTLYAQWQINTYDLSVKHTVSGNMGNKCSDFSFTLNLSGMSGNNITAVFTDASGKQTTKTLAMNNGKVAFMLKHGETVVFKNVPYNTSYTITEDNVRDYIVSSSNASGKVTDNTAATFTSVRNMMVPTSADTNIIAMISIICVAGVAILLILKRRKTK